ncbi:MAG: fimbria major subunit, partial [Muribaculaceae bacterium]|nr:fimbria major subunit [Muribaculaceae bacterium]
GFPESGALLQQFRQKVTGATFTIYQGSEDPKSGWGYYCYYYYWNHHNDNLNNTVLGPMEVAVVRNNVYKLAVTRLNVLGHPRIPENDPDTPTPDNPDEKGDLYLQVSVKVAPWVVRLNNIEF